MNEIVGVVVASGVIAVVVSWLLNRRLFRAQVDHTIAQAASEIIDIYKECNIDLRNRLVELEAKVNELSIERKNDKRNIGMMARVISAILKTLNDYTIPEHLYNIAEDARISDSDMAYLHTLITEVNDE